MPSDLSSREMMPHAVAAQSASKREENRQRVLLRAHIHVVHLQSELMVTDISRSGLRGTTELNLCVDQQAYVSLDTVTHVAGSIRWTQGRRFGMKFSKLLDDLPECAQIRHGPLPVVQARLPRPADPLKARLSLCNWSSTARIRNVSKTGMMVEAELPVIPGQQLLVHLSDGKIFDATVKWVEGDRAGIRLAAPAAILNRTFGDLT